MSVVGKIVVCGRKGEEVECKDSGTREENQEGGKNFAEFILKHTPADFAEGLYGNLNDFFILKGRYYSYKLRNCRINIVNHNLCNYCSERFKCWTNE